MFPVTESSFIIVGVALAGVYGLAKHWALVDRHGLHRPAILILAGFGALGASHAVDVYTALAMSPHQALAAATPLPTGRFAGWQPLAELAGIAGVTAGICGLVSRLLPKADAAASLDRAQAHRQLVEEQLAASERKLQTLIDALPMLIGYVDKEQRWRINNKEYENWTGRRREELAGLRIRDGLGERAYATVLPYVERALSGERLSFNATVGYDHGGTRHIRAVFVPDIDPDGEVAGYFSTAIDITDLKRAEDALKEARDDLESRVRARTADLRRQRDFARSLVESAPMIVLILTPKGKIDFVNPYFERLTGYRLDEIRGKDWFDTFLPPRDRARIRALFDNAIQAKPTRGNVYPILTRCGEERDIEWSDEVLSDDAGEIVSLLAIGMNATERRRLEAEREEEHERLRTILDGMFAFVGLYSPDGVLIEANRAPLEAANLSREEVIGRPFWDAYWWSYSAQTQAQVRTALRRAAEGAVVREDFVVRLSESRFITIDAMFGPLRDARGRITGVIGSGVDITERLQVEEQLRESERRLVEAQRIAQLGSWELDLTKGTLSWSDEIYRMFEIDPTQFGASYDAFLDAIHPDDRDMVDKAYTDSLINRSPYDVIHRLLMSDGRIKWVKERCETEFDAEGKPLMSRGTVQDITDQQMADIALRENRAMLSGIFEISEEAIIIADSKLRVSLFSRGAQRIFGYDAEEANNLTIERLIPERFHDEHRTYVQQFKQGPDKSLRMGARRELTAVRKGGEEFPAAISLSKFQRGGGVYYSMIVRDIGPEKEARANLLAAKLAAETANQTKSRFLANMSHELRTPLNAIIGFSEIIYSQAHGAIGNEKYVGYASDINKSGMHLLEIINDILDLSKVEAGELELHEEAVCVYDVVNSSLRMVKERANKGAVNLTTNSQSDIPPLYADECKLKQILINLLANAIKFTPAGGEVQIRVWYAGNSGVVFQITDTGIGIAPEDIYSALTPFKQIEGDFNRKFEGTGLGLPLAKLLTERHGGSLDLQSQVGIGTTVTIRLPATRVMWKMAAAK